MRMKIALVMMQYMRASCSLAAERQDGRVAELGFVRSAIRTLTRTPLPYAGGWAHVLRASLALRARDHERAASSCASPRNGWSRPASSCTPRRHAAGWDSCSAAAPGRASWPRAKPRWRPSASSTWSARARC
jgi:hypothetical protein